MKVVYQFTDVYYHYMGDLYSKSVKFYFGHEGSIGFFHCRSSIVDRRLY